jgi:formate dehydrogenase subunit gamma
MAKITLLQPKNTPDKAALAVCEHHGNRPDALLEILHDVQEELGHVPEATLPAIAKALNLSRAEVYGVATFYHDFHLKPQGRHTIKICRAEACQAMGARELQAMAEKFLKVKMGETTADRKVTLEATYCLGLCASSPAIMVDGAPKARVDAKAFKQIVAGLK